jgi:DNA replication protein DnaC
MRGLTEEAAAVAIDVATRVLHLPTVRTSAGELAAAAVRDRRRRERRIAEARFPRTKRLSEFDLGATPSIAPATLAALATSDWISAGEPVVLLRGGGQKPRSKQSDRCRRRKGLG